MAHNPDDPFAELPETAKLDIASIQSSADDWLVQPGPAVPEQSFQEQARDAGAAMDPFASQPQDVSQAELGDLSLPTTPFNGIDR